MKGAPDAREGWTLDDLSWEFSEAAQSMLLQALVQTGHSRGKPVRETALTIRIETGAPSSGATMNDVRELAGRILEGLAPAPAVPAEAPRDAPSVW